MVWTHFKNQDRIQKMIEHEMKKKILKRKAKIKIERKNKEESSRKRTEN